MITFKTDRQKAEYNDISGKLRQLIEMLSLYMWLKYGRQIMITELKRTQEEQDDIYSKHSDKAVRAKYKKKAWSSVHQFDRGADIRTHDWERHEIKDALFWLNQIVYDKKRPRKKTAIYHDIGTGEHLHLQVL